MDKKCELKIRDVTIDGDGIGKITKGYLAGDDRVVFCFGAKMPIADETVKCEIVKENKKYLVARPLGKDFAKTAKCSVYPDCGGCSLLHFDYKETLALKQKVVLDAITRIGGISADSFEFEPILPSNPCEKYRNKMIYRFAKDKNGGLVSGFFRRDSHDVVPMSSCFPENETSKKIRLAFIALANKYKLSIYDETTGKGFLRELMVRTSLAFGDAMVVVCSSGDNLPSGFADELAKNVPEISSVYLNVNKKAGNTILGDSFKLLYGKATLADKIGPAGFEISPESFFQVNPYQTPRLYEKAYEYGAPTDGENILDLYCGIGTIGQYFATRMREEGKSPSLLSGIEYTEKAIDNAKYNAKLNNLACKTAFFAGDAEVVLKELIEKGSESAKPTICVVDPPRKGLSTGIIDSIASLHSIERLVYVSCNPATLARDLSIFAEKGFATKKVCPCDMFPFAGHVETVVVIGVIGDGSR